jgi:hypothetical protein
MQGPRAPGSFPRRRGASGARQFVFRGRRADRGGAGARTSLGGACARAKEGSVMHTCCARNRGPLVAAGRSGPRHGCVLGPQQGWVRARACACGARQRGRNVGARAAAQLGSERGAARARGWDGARSFGGAARARLRSARAHARAPKRWAKTRRARPAPRGGGPGGRGERGEGARAHARVRLRVRRPLIIVISGATGRRSRTSHRSPTPRAPRRPGS